MFRKRREAARQRHEAIKAAVRGRVNIPHPRGAEVWERVVDWGDEGERLSSIGLVQDARGQTVIDADQFRFLLVAAGYALRGIADGTAPTYDRQVDQQ